MCDERERYIQIRTWNLARSMVAAGAPSAMVALAFVQVAEELLPPEGEHAKKAAPAGKPTNSLRVNQDSG